MIENNPIQPALPLQKGTAPAPLRKTAGELSFGQVLEKNLRQSTDLKFSAHAQQRLDDRKIQLNASDLSRLNQGVAAAAAKGANESLLLKDGVGFVVSIKNNTVITAVDSASMKGNVFTNIDSALIV